MDREALINVETVRTLAHVALMATAEGQVPDADRILVALESVRPKEPVIRVCRAMLLTRQERFTECLSLLKGLFQEHPKNQTVKSILGFVMFTTEEAGWRPLLQEVVDDGSDAASVELAKMILTEGQDSEPSNSRATAESRQFIRYG